MTLADLSLVGLVFLAPVSAIIFSFFRLGSPALRRVMGLAAPLSLMCFFVCCINPSVGDRMTLIVPGLFELNQVGAYCGILFNFIYCVVFIAFGERVFFTRSGGIWIAIQALISLALISEHTEVFALSIISALVIHLKVSQSDVYQVSRRQDRYVLVVFCSVLAVVLTILFFGAVGIVYNIYSFAQLTGAGGSFSWQLKVLSSILMMLMLGAFPLHFWVKPLFGAPARYGMAVITRINIGFVVWCKLYPLIFSGDSMLDQVLIYGCGANLLYAAFLLFGERRLSQIVSALYLFHVPLLILAVHESGPTGVPDFVLDFANITVAISGLLIILGMLRDRLGAESLDRASGLALSYPFIGIAFLICVLSLVGFPGTLGFISSEVILHHFAEKTGLVAVCFIITLALNGYSSFRIFGESFYGDPAQSYRKIFQPLLREKVAIAMVLFFLFASGLGSQLLAPPQYPH